MLEFDLSFFLIAGFAALFAGISKGGFGSAAAFASASILALVVEPGLALGVMLPLLILIDATTLRPYWGQWHGPSAVVLALSGLPGVLLGTWLYTIVDENALRVLIGAVSIAFVLWQLRPHDWARGTVANAPLWVGALAGAGAGFTSFISHAGGPVAAIYLLGRGLPKTQYQATTVVVFGFINIVKVFPYAFLGMFTWQTVQANLILAPFAVLGAWIGVVLHKAVPEKLFFGLTYVLLLVTGTKLILDGVL